MFLKNLQNLQKKQLWQSVVFNKVTVSIFFKKKFISKHLCRALVFNKVEGWRYNINIKLLIHLHFFKAPLLTKSKLTALFAQCTLTHDWLFVICKDQKLPSRVFVEKGILKICSKFTGKHPCQCAI